MEPARLASSKQQQAAASSKQQATSPAGPLAGPRATGVPKWKKMLPPYPGWFSVTFSERLFFWSDPHRLATAIQWFFWPVLGFGHLHQRHNLPVPCTEPYCHVFCPTSSRVTGGFQSSVHFLARCLRLFLCFVRKGVTWTQQVYTLR